MNIEAIPENIETYGTNSDKLLHRLLYKDIHPVDLQFFFNNCLFDESKY